MQQKMWRTNVLLTRFGEWLSAIVIYEAKFLKYMILVG